MKRALTFLLAFCICNFALAENFFMRQGATGTRSGADISNAFTNWNNVTWGSGAGQLGAGDTLYILAGSYSSITPGGSGTAGAVDSTWIKIWRALDTDSAVTSSAGYNASYIGAITNSGVSMPTAHLGEYVWYSGRGNSAGTNAGWVVTVGVGSSAINWPSYSVNNLIFDGIEIRGPAPHPQTTAYNFGLGNSTRGFDMTAWNGAAWQNITNVWITNNWIHGVVDCIYFANVSQTHIENNVICDNWTVGDTAIDQQHENVLLTLVSHDISFRNNSISNWAVEGIEFGYVNYNWLIEGNLWKKMSAGPYARGLETQYQGSYNITNINNTYIDLWLCIYNDNSGGGWTTSTLKNNVFINSGLGNLGAGWDKDYNAFDGANTETHGLANITTAVFQNFGARDYRSVTNIASNRLRQKGVDLGNGYIDAFGTDRDADGAWTIGFAAIVPPGQGEPPGDTTPPTLSSIAAGGISQTAATITWTTDESATSGVKYGLTASYGSTVTNGNSYALSQSLALSGLTANTTYHYQPWSSDVAGNTASNVDLTFTTANIVVNATTFTITGP